MSNLKFRRRVAVYRHDDLLYHAGPAAVEALVYSGRASVKTKTAKQVSAIELNDIAGDGKARVGLLSLGLRAGSFGIATEAFESGVACYSHKNPWDELVPCPT